MKFFLAVSLNPIKRFDLKNCQPDSLTSLSFELNRVGNDSKWLFNLIDPKTTWMTNKKHDMASKKL